MGRRKEEAKDEGGDVQGAEERRGKKSPLCAAKERLEEGLGSEDFFEERLELERAGEA